jgi:hypothetical protein
MKRKCNCGYVWLDDISIEQDIQNRAYIDNFKKLWDKQKATGISDIRATIIIGEAFVSRYYRLSILYDCPSCGLKMGGYNKIKEVKQEVKKEVKSNGISPVIIVVAVIVWLLCHII